MGADYVPSMAEWMAVVTRVRTTSGGSGPAEGVITGVGATPAEALAGLWEAAERPARQAVQRVAQAAVTAERAKRERQRREAVAMAVPTAGSGSSPEASVPQVSAARKATTPRGVTVPSGAIETRRDWQFEVIDVRLVPAQLEGGNSGWLAYGTLVWDVGFPSAASPGAGGVVAGPATGVRQGPR